MTPNSCKKIENDFEFKYRYFKKTKWWKNIVLIAPVGFLFAGLIGIVTLFKRGMLLSWYLIPYLALFIAGTVLFKSLRLHIRKTKMNEDGSYLVCLAKNIGMLDGFVYTIFTSEQKRHNGKILEDICNEIDSKELMQDYKRIARNESIALDSSEHGKYYLRAYFNNTLSKTNANWDKDKYFPLLYVDDRYTFVVTGKDIKYYS